jgi:hypothetical protein
MVDYNLHKTLQTGTQIKTAFCSVETDLVPL